MLHGGGCSIKVLLFETLPQGVLWNRGCDFDVLFRYGVDKFHASCVKRDASVGVGAFGTVFEVAFYGAAYGRQLAPYLVVATGDRWTYYLDKEWNESNKSYTANKLQGIVGNIHSG